MMLTGSTCTPKVGRSAYGRFYYWSIRRQVRQVVERDRIDVILGTWAYPDGYAAYLVARDLGIPCVIKAHGTDINEYIESRTRRKMIVHALNGSAKVVAVSRALKNKMAEAGVAGDRIEVIYNGVDRQTFRPIDRQTACSRVGLEPGVKRVLFVGNLKPVKGLEYLIDAMAGLAAHGSPPHLHIVGYGLLESSLKERVSHKRLEGKVHFEGERDHAELPTWLNACDVLCLPSISEGVPNVVLEALSCGTPVVASNVGGIPEIVTGDEAGILVEPRRPRQIAEAIRRVLDSDWDKDSVSRLTEGFDWEESASKLRRVLDAAAHPDGAGA